MGTASLEVVDRAEDATWEWYCAHHGILMSPREIPLETVEPLLGDLLARVTPGLVPRVRLGLVRPDPVTGENCTWDATAGVLLVDGPALTDELFVQGPLRLLRLAARIAVPDHTFDEAYRSVMVTLAGVAFTSTVAAHLRRAYDAEERS